VDIGEHGIMGAGGTVVSWTDSALPVNTVSRQTFDVFCSIRPVDCRSSEEGYLRMDAGYWHSRSMYLSGERGFPLGYIPFTLLEQSEMNEEDYYGRYKSDFKSDA